MRRASIQVEIIEENDSLTFIFYGMHGEKRKEPLPFATQAARRVNKNLYYTILSILQEYQPTDTIEGSIVYEEE